MTENPFPEHHPTIRGQPSDKDARRNNKLELSSDPLRSEKAPEPGEQDRTVIRPVPGGSRSRGASMRAAILDAAALPTPGPLAGPDIDAIATGHTPLAIAASPLLHLLARLRNTVTAPDPGDMRERTRRELRAFERRASEAGVPMEQMRQAHYALCAALDDVVLNTPWGGQGRWREAPLSLALHKDEQSGPGFFDQLRTLRTTLPDGLPVMELMFICLSLGMIGPYRTAPDGPAQLERVRHQVFGLIEQAGAMKDVALSDTVAGVRLPPPPRTRLPIWVAASAALGLVSAVYVACLTNLNAASDAFYLEAAAAPPSTMPALLRPPATPPPPPPPEPAPANAALRLRAALSDQPAVEVVTTPAATIIRIAATTLFPAGNATPAPGPLLERVARAIGAEPGPLRVVGYTDTTPPRSVAFPSKFALSNARATAIKTALARLIPDPARLTAEGRADADPIATNATPEGRERNRRIEIVLAAGPG